LKSSYLNLWSAEISNICHLHSKERIIFRPWFSRLNPYSFIHSESMISKMIMAVKACVEAINLMVDRQH
jgi:hypothetical protein